MPITRISSSINQGQTMHCPLVLPPMQLPRSLSLQARSARLRMTFSNWYFLFPTTIWFCFHYYCTTYTYHGRLLVNLLLSVYNVTLSCLWMFVSSIRPPTLSAYPQQSIPSSTLCVCSCQCVSVSVCVRVYILGRTMRQAVSCAEADIQELIAFCKCISAWDIFEFNPKLICRTTTTCVVSYVTDRGPRTVHQDFNN